MKEAGGRKPAKPIYWRSRGRVASELTALNRQHVSDAMLSKTILTKAILSWEIKLYKCAEIICTSAVDSSR